MVICSVVSALGSAILVRTTFASKLTKSAYEGLASELAALQAAQRLFNNLSSV